MTELPRVITTGELLEERPHLPRLAPEVISKLHPHGRHLVLELQTYGTEEAHDGTCTCTVVAASRSGGTFKFTHLLPGKFVRRLPAVDSLLVELLDHFQDLDTDQLVSQLEQWLQVSDRQLRLPLDTD